MTTPVNSNESWLQTESKAIAAQQATIQNNYQTEQTDQAKDDMQVESQILSNITTMQEEDYVAPVQTQVNQVETTQAQAATQSAASARRALRSVNLI